VSALPSRPLLAWRGLARALALLPGAQALMAPVLVVAILALMVLPVAPWLLDTFFTLNIAVALMVMMVAAYMTRPLDFAAFPTVVLLTTLMRLSLNVASTRVVLLHGHSGAQAAGSVIEAFGHFLIGGNFAVGLIVFAILVVINFVVITKGAERIAEVSARFTLDAMPGKQMAVDADLNAGLIDDKEAKRRRAEVQEEANFFGSMDGASKFVRGDAIAGILILLINILGGLAVGMAQHGLSLAQAADSYILLAVGDALVAQIPGLLISVAAAMVISRVGKDADVGAQIAQQLLTSPKVLGITAAVLALLGATPGMPHLVFMGMAIALAALGWYVARQQGRGAAAALQSQRSAGAQAEAEASWDDLQPVDLLGLELGYRLIALVGPQQRGAHEGKGDLFTRIKGVRRKFAQDVGFLPPAVHVRDNLDLKPSSYRILLRGVVVGEGEAFPGMFLAINPGGITTPLLGTPTRDPAFGLSAHWIDERQKEAAQMAGFTVVDAPTVLATHLSHVMQQQAAQLLSRSEVQQLLEHLGRCEPRLMEDVVPKLIGLALFHKVLQLLLQDQVSVRDMRSIVEALAEHGSATQEAQELARRVRIALAPAIVQQIHGTGRELNVMAIEPQLEQLLVRALAGSAAAALDPGVAELLTQQALEATRQQEALGLSACLLVPDAVRAPLARLLRRAVPRLHVLAHSEIPDTHTIRIGPVLKGSSAA